MDKNKVRHESMNFLGSFGKNIKTKLSNVCAKTGQYNVPSELFQKRTPRSNRALISWKTVKNNNLTIDELNSFEGGVVVELLNNDFFDENNYSNEVFNCLINRIGSDDNISSIISIRAEGGSSSSAIQRKAFENLTNNTTVLYKGEKVIINVDNYMDYKILQRSSGGTGNEKWSGFLFISIKGGQQDTIETHHGEELTIFNPACEYASADVRQDLDLVVMYFMLFSIDRKALNAKENLTYDKIRKDLEDYLKECEYDNESYKGNLLEYCQNHPSLKLHPGKLTDPIQLKNIPLEAFDLENRQKDSIDFTHSEAVNLDKYYWDKIHKTLLSPANPTNVFWSYHLSNMMQQDYTLEEYFEYEKERYEQRKLLLKSN